MKKDAYYFPHDSNAKDDPKCILMIEQLGLEGYGIYWILIETLRDQPGYCYPIILLPAIARRFNTTYEKIKTVVFNYNLFTIKDDTLFFSQSLCDRMIIMDVSREKQRQKALKRWGKDAAALPEHSHGSAELMPLYNNIIDNNRVDNSIENDTIEDKHVPTKTKRFCIPSKSEIEFFFIEEKEVEGADAIYYAERFVNFYESKNWMVGKNKMTNWKTAAVRSMEWEDKRATKSSSKFGYNQINDEDVLKRVMNS